MSCNKVILFYEIHSNPIVTKTINSLVPLLKNIGIKSLCFEEPSDLTREYKISNYEEILKETQKLNDPKLLEIYVKNFLDYTSSIPSEGEGVIGEDGLKLDYKKYKNLPEDEKKSIRDGIKNMFAGDGASAIQDALVLLKKTNNIDFHYCGFDYPTILRESLEQSNKNYLEKYDIRNEYMAKRIFQQCESKGDVVLFVGASHFKLAQNLQKLGVVHVEEYYVADYAPLFRSSEKEENCLRPGDHSDIEYCADYTFNGLFVDLYNHPELNATEIVGKNLLINHIIQNVEL